MFKKAAAILLAFIFLVSSSHLSFATHFCGGKAFKHALLISTSDFGCGMEKEAIDCKNQPQLTNKSCCDTQLIQYSIKENFQSSKVEVNSEPIIAFLNTPIILFSFQQNECKPLVYKTHKVPLPKKDIPVLFQSFLI